MTDGTPRRVGRRTFGTALLAGIASGCLRLDGEEEAATAGPGTTGARATTAGASSTARSTATAAPTEAPTEEPTPTPEPTMELPPGVSEDGVTTELAEIHGEVTEEFSYTMEHVHDFGGSRTTTTHRVEPNRTRYRRERDDGSSQLSVFGAEGTKYARREGETGTVFGVVEVGDSTPSLSFRPTARRILATGAFELTGTNPGRTPKTADIAANAVDDPQPFARYYPIESYEAFSGEGVVREFGLVETLAFESVVLHSNDGEELTFSKRLETSAVDDTSVTRPDWTADAEERAPRLAAERAREDLVVLDHLEGQPVPTDSLLFVAPGDETYLGHTTFELAAGETYYLYATGPDSDAGKGVRIRRDRPESGSSVSLGDSTRLAVSYLGVQFLMTEV